MNTRACTPIEVKDLPAAVTEAIAKNFAESTVKEAAVEAAEDGRDVYKRQGNERRLTTSIFGLSEIFHVQKMQAEDIEMLGLIKNVRAVSYTHLTQAENSGVPYFAGLRTRGCTQADGCPDGRNCP